MVFKNRAAAGQRLAEQLAAYANRADVILLALPRGGVPVAFEIAKALSVALNVLIVRKLGVPGYQELAMGAIASGGARVLNRNVIRAYRVSKAAIKQVMAEEQQELERRQQLYCDHPLPALHNQTVILVDDGLATGATMRVAVLAVRQQHPARIVVAVPVASFETYQEIQKQVDEAVCLETPDDFLSVGTWYENFEQVTDSELKNLLNQLSHTGTPKLSGETSRNHSSSSSDSDPIELL